MFAPPASETCVLLLFFSTSLPFTSSFSVSRSSLSLPLPPPKRVLDCLLPGGILLADKLKQREKETTEEGEEEALFSTWHSRSFGLIAKQHANYPHTLTYSLFFVYRQHHSYPKLEQDLRIKKSRKEDRGFSKVLLHSVKESALFWQLQKRVHCASKHCDVWIINLPLSLPFPSLRKWWKLHMQIVKRR